MRRAKKDRKREDRIVMEIIVDAYGPEEQAMGWYYYLQDKLTFPFVAHCISERAISPLHKGDEVEIIDMAPEDECSHEMFVKIRWEKRGLAGRLPSCCWKQTHSVGPRPASDDK